MHAHYKNDNHDDSNNNTVDDGDDNDNGDDDDDNDDDDADDDDDDDDIFIRYFSLKKVCPFVSIESLHAYVCGFHVCFFLSFMFAFLLILLPSCGKFQQVENICYNVCVPLSPSGKRLSHHVYICAQLPQI